MQYEVSVTGLGCMCAAGDCMAVVMENVYAGRRSPAAPRRISCEHEIVYPVFELAALPPASGAYESASVRMLLAVTREALAQSGLDLELLRSKRVGICIGTTTGASLNFADDYFTYRDEAWSSDSGQVRTWLHSNPALAVSKHFGLSGPCQTIVNACSSGTDAIGTGMAWLRNDLCDIVLAGGVDELSAISYNGFIRLGIYDPSPCRPFDMDRKGLNLGEGAAMLILEKRGDVLSRNAAVLASCAGYGTSADAHHLTAPSPDGEGLIRAIRTAMTEASVLPDDISFVNAHGTGTPDNDAVESHVLSSVLPGTPISTTKGYTGHTLGAAGAIEAAFVVQALRDKRIPASAGFESQAPDWPAVPVSEPTTLPMKFGMSQSLAFGGNNSVIIFATEE
jgi:3-oxoacyl-[acyl-carrier-protein] synthase-1/3-oxoacyl-[acyl-carrier-protein] synthase II